tara:strand:- start:940 stop:1977 length:1038 start_codon:yes stop_codon:yes gene_type:complete
MVMLGCKTKRNQNTDLYWKEDINNVILCGDSQLNSDAFNLYISQNGNDKNSGLIESEPIKSLSKAQQVLILNQPKSDIQINILPGVYLNQSITWSFNNGFCIKFTALHHTDSIPIFDGNGKGFWFRYTGNTGKPSNLIFNRIKIRNYKQGIAINGNREILRGWNGSNFFHNMIFEKIGSLYSSDKSPAYSALGLVNSRNNFIDNCFFINIENEELNDADILMHSIYFAHNSSDNVVTNSFFINNSGDPVRFRDNSNNNVITKCVFINSGSHALASEWYCSSETTSKPCTKNSIELVSKNNIFVSNKFGTGYNQANIDLIRTFGSSNDFKQEIRIITKRNKCIIAK